MAEGALLAFGRYVKMLRERRALSLDDVVTLTRVYPSPLNKGYISRVERGLTRVGFDKMIGFGRAYDVPMDVLAERLWLDMELDTTAPPETYMDELQEMLGRAHRISIRGLLWHAYAHVRDAQQLALSGPVVSRFTSRAEQIAIWCADVASVAARLGALRFALHEVKVAKGLLPDGSDHAAVMLVHLSSLSRRLNDLPAARAYADQALAATNTAESKKYAGYALSVRGTVAQAENDIQGAIEDYKNAITAFRESDLESECSIQFVNIAQAYFDLRRIGAAKRSLLSAEKLAAKYAMDHVRIRSRVLLGEILEAEGAGKDAQRLWREAAELARQCRNRTLVFQADFLIFRQAATTGQLEMARAVAKKLVRLSPWVMPALPELHEFRALLKKYPEILRRQRQVVT